MDPVKIDRERKRKTTTGRVAKRSRTRRAAAPQRTARAFSNKLLSAQVDSVRKQLETLFTEIDFQAKEIETSLTFESLAVYKELVRKFVHVIVHELFVIEEKLSISPTGRKKCLLIVRKLDEKLEKLAEEFMGRQTNLVDFMARLDDIRGLLLDLYS